MTTIDHEATIDRLEATLATREATTGPVPPDYTYGLSELIRAHRLYMGLSQRAMAERLRKDRRDYQRIENDDDACPPGLLGRMELMVDHFDSTVDAVIDAARQSGGAKILIDTDPALEWERAVVNRAALLCHTDADAPTITLER